MELNYNLQETTVVELTKEFILSKISEEEIWTFYGVPITKSLFKSPLRADRRPSASIHKNKNGKIVLRDWANGWQGDIWAFIQEIFQVGYTKALSIVAHDFGLIKTKDYKVNKRKIEYNGDKVEESPQAIIQVEIRDFQDYELKWWNSYGISKETLNHFNVFSCKNVWLNGNIFSLVKDNQKIFGYYGGINSDKVEQWRIYYPQSDKTKSKFKFISNWKATKIQGAAQLPKEGGDLLVITKSLKDCMTLYGLGITAIAPNSENLFVTEAQYNKLKSKFKHIVLFYDNDQPGIQAMRKIKREHPELAVLFIPRNYEAKDISDFRKKYGKNNTIALIEQAKKAYNKWLEKGQAPTTEQEDNERSRKS